MTLTVRLDSALESALARYSGERGVTKSLVVQEALAEYLTKAGATGAQAKARPRGEVSENYKAFERAGLIGAVAGDGRSATKEVVREHARRRITRNWR
jgi:predicted transcriptional regulator